MDIDSSHLFGFLAGFGVLSGVIAYNLKKQDKRDEYRQAMTEAKIKESRSDLKVHIERLSGDFKEMRANLENALKNMQHENHVSAENYEKTLQAIKLTIQKAEVRFSTLSKELKELHMIVDKFKH